MNIEKLYEAGRLPHAVLFTGDADSEHAVARLLDLHGCNKSDTVRVKASMPDSTYKIKPLREVVGTGNLRPQFGDVRAFVFDEFDTMSEICQNALLKFIEEPHSFNRFIMTATTTEKILTTILSRVVVIRSDGFDEQGGLNTIETAIVEALRRGGEYETVAAFALIKDRQSLGNTLQSLLHSLSADIAVSDNPEKIIKATDIIQKYIRRMEINPNINITTASCAAELHTALK